MAVLPTDIHGVGELLRTNRQHGEAVVRAAYGRAYYAVYHTFRRALRQAHNDQNLDVHHDDLVHYLIGSGRTLLRTLGALLKPLLQFRTDSDYKLDLAITDARLEALLDDAAEIVSKESEIATAAIGLPRPDSATWLPVRKKR
jgi:hypothetical protein